MSISSAILSSVMTIYLTHYHFWKYQRRGELRLKAIDEVNTLTSDFITGYIADNENYIPDHEWFKSFQAAAAKIKALFSTETFQSFKTMEVMVGPNLGPSFRAHTVNDFIVGFSEEQGLNAHSH